MGNTTIPYCHILDATPYLASFGNEIVIGIDDQNCSKSTSWITFAMFSLPNHRVPLIVGRASFSLSLNGA